MIHFEKNNDKYAYGTVFVSSFFFSVIAKACEPYLNHDGIWYVAAAKALIEDGFTSSFNAYYWPFYSYFIALIHKATNLSFEISSFLLNSILLGSVCVVFVKIYDDITQKKGNLWVPCILILTLNSINKYRDDVMRDFGYWFFTLVGVYCLIHYFKNPKWKTALGWQISIMTAFLFRIESIVFLLLGPIVLFFKSSKIKALREFFALQILLLLCSMAIFAGYLFKDTGKIKSSALKILYIFEFFDLSNLAFKFHEAVSNIGNIFFYDGLNLGKHFPTLSIVLLSAMIVYCAIKISICLTPPYAAIFVYGTVKKWFPLSIENRLILFFSGIQILILFSYLIKEYLIVPRYATVLSLLLLLIVGQIVEYGFRATKSWKYRKLIIVLFSGLIILQTGDSLITFHGYSKRHIVKAGYWINGNIDKSIPIFSTDLKAIHYADRRYVSGKEISRNEMFSRIESKKFKGGTRLIVHGKKEELDKALQEFDHRIKTGDIEIEKEFENSEGDWVFILKVIDSSE